jgi:hypothetical protein
VILTAKQSNNDELFADIVSLYVKECAEILDATYGLGNFWKLIDVSKYRLIRNDLYKDGLEMKVDFRNLPLSDDSLDVVVLDPPYAQHGTPMKASIAEPYGCDCRGPKSEKEVLEWYRDGAAESNRVLRDGGLLILKTQDSIESGKQVWKHAELLNLPGFLCEDLFVLVQKAIPAARWSHQKHARKNHSYFLVHRKKRHTMLVLKTGPAKAQEAQREAA